MSTTVPPVIEGATFELVVSGHPPVHFTELGEVRNEITNINGVLAGRRPRQLGIVMLRDAPWGAQELWLQTWYRAARQGRPGARMDFSVLVTTGSQPRVRCDGTSGWPTRLVLGTLPTPQGQNQILRSLTLHCSALKVEYF